MKCEVSNHVVVVVQIPAVRSEKHFCHFEPPVVDEELEEESGGHKVPVITTVRTHTRHILIGEQGQEEIRVHSDRHYLNHSLTIKLSISSRNDRTICKKKITYLTN